MPGGEVNLGRSSFAPTGDRPSSIVGQTPEFPCLLNPLPGILGSAPMTFTYKKFSALGFRPRQPAPVFQLGDLTIMDLE